VFAVLVAAQSLKAEESYTSRVSYMAISDEVLNTTIEHIYVYESQAGTLEGKDPTGDTKGDFHMKVNIASLYDKSFKGMTQEQYNNAVTYERERELVREHVLTEAARLEAAGVDFNALEMGESVAYLSTTYNYGNQPNTLQCYKNLSYARKNMPNRVEEFRVQAKNSLDVTRDEGEVSMGVMQRSMSHQRTFDGNLNVNETYQAKKDYTAQEKADLYADITSRSKKCYAFNDQVKKSNILQNNEEIIYITEPTQAAELPTAGFTEQPKEVVGIDMFPAPEVIRGDMQ